MEIKYRQVNEVHISPEYLVKILPKFFQNFAIWLNKKVAHSIKNLPKVAQKFRQMVNELNFF